MIHGSNESKHDEILMKVLERARNVGLKFNKSKCKIRQKEVMYLGHKFSGKGVAVDDTKIKAIVEMPRPQSVSELLRFLGMVTYLSSFVKDLSQETIYEVF